MTARDLFDILLPAWFGLSLVAFLVLVFIPAPYGRHRDEGWGPTMPARTGWVVMELPAVLVPIVVFVHAKAWTDLPAVVFLAMWLWHYGYRTFWWPLKTVAPGKRMPVLICALAVLTNLGIDWLNAAWVFDFGRPWTNDWFGSGQFLLGSLLFVVGMSINRRADGILRNLRKPGETGYKIPRGGPYRWVSCPNYLGELLEWTGWAIATWSLAGLAFVVWTAANLVPRAAQHHRWYRETFDDYPRDRKALIPYVW